MGKFWMAVAVGLAVLAGVAQAASPVNFSHPAYVQVAEATSIPVGHANFCMANPQECMPTPYVEAVALSEGRWSELVAVNAAVNAAVAPVSDFDLYQVEEYWAYPHGYGDCEDYVLAKRKDLITMGWPASALLITVVRQANGEGHAVLTVRTDRGDLVLDNQDSLIKVWQDTPYHYIKRQSQTDAGRWVSLVDNRPQIVLAAR